MWKLNSPAVGWGRVWDTMTFKLQLLAFWKHLMWFALYWYFDLPFVLHALHPLFFFLFFFFCVCGDKRITFLNFYF